MKKHTSPWFLLIATLGCAAGWIAPRASFAAIRLDPFAREAGPPATLPTPFHSTRANVESASPPPASQNEVRNEQVAPSPNPAKAAQNSAPPRTACSRDDECPVDTICEDTVCRSFERPIDILLYRQQGRSTALLPFYWSQRGTPGYRVLAPFYFHFWSSEARTQIVAPFYWRVEDHLKQRVVVVVPPYAQTTQPDARSWAVWPFFYVSTKFGWAVPLLGSFRVGEANRGNAMGMWLLLYYWKSTPTSKFDLIFPFAVSKRSKESAFTYAVPLNFYWRHGDDRNLLAIPFFYRNAKPEGGNFASPLGYSSVENQATTGSFLWLYWYGRAKTSNYDVLFPLLWSFRSPGANTTILPPFFHFRSGTSSLGTFAFLGWWSRDEKLGSNWQLVLPFYFRRSSDHGGAAYYLWPTGSYRRDDPSDSRYFTMLLPPILHWRDKSGELDFDLLYYHHHDIPGDARTTIAGPYYRRDDPAGTTRSIFPLWWYFRDGATGATAHSLLPFYFRRNSPDEKMTAAGIFPVWFYHRSFSDGGGSTGLFPLAFFGSRKDKSHQVVFPIFWHFRKGQTSTTLLFPIFYAARDKTSASTHVFPALYFSGHDHGDSYRVQFPFYWNMTHAQSGVSTTLAGLYFHHRDPKGYAAGIAPLLFWGSRGKESHFALVPIFWWFRDEVKDRTTTVVANYLHRRYGDETTDAFFPLFHYRRGAKPGSSDETSLTVFPLLHYRRDKQNSVFASPLAVWTHTPTRQAGFVGPYFWYRSEKVAAQGVPLLYLDHTQLDTGERTRMWGPYLALDGDTHQTRALFPFFARYRNASETGTYIFPTYVRRQTQDGYRLDTFFPLLWLSQSPTSHTTQVGSYFSHHSPAGTSSGLLPFYVTTHTPKRDLLITPLFLSHTNHQTETRRVFSWIHYQSERRDEMIRYVFPLWWQSRNQDKSRTVLAPLFWHLESSQAKQSYTALGFLLYGYWAQKDSERTRGILPLFWYSRDEERGTASNAVMPLFYERHAQNSQTVLTVPFGYHRAPDNRWWYAGNFFWRDTPKMRFNTFFPLWFQHREKSSETQTLVIPPLLHYARTSPSRSLSTWFLLFWQHSDITSSSTVGWPLLFDFHSYHQSRLTMVLPLFLRYRNEISGKAYSFAPLFYRRSGPTDSTTVGFPLLWRFWSEERSTTVVFPFYVNVKRPTSDASYVFPNIYYRKGLGSEAGTSHLFVFPFWESEVKRPGDYMWQTLLGLVGWERIGRNRFLKLLFIPFELQAAPAAQTAWYGKPPARARERMARSVDIRSW